VGNLQEVEKLALTKYLLPNQRGPVNMRQLTMDIYLKHLKARYFRTNRKGKSQILMNFARLAACIESMPSGY